MKNIFRLTAVVGVLAVWVLAVACSDGATPVIPELQCSLPQPTAGLMAKKVGEADEAAVKGKITIASGEGVVILWDVQGLSGGEIVSNPPEVIGQPEQLIVVEEEKEIVNADGVKEKQKVKTAKGSKEFTVLKENVEFTLKAINTDKDLPCENVTSSVSVEVTPETAKPEVKKFEATPTQLNAGESSKLCWEVTPESAAVTIVDDAGNALVPSAPPEVDPTGTTENPPATPEVPTSGQLSASAVAKALIAEGESVPETGFKAIDCVHVRPEKDTTYTLTARANDATVTEEASVTMVSVEFKIVSFAANSVEGSLTLDAEGDVKLTWEVTPSEGVLVSIDNGVGEDLPANGDATVKVSDNTIYTLSASRNGVVLARQVTVNVNRIVVAQGLNIQLTASGTSVFAGEPVALSWQVTGADGSVATLAEGSVVTLVGPDGSVPVSGGGAEIKPMVSGAYSIDVATGGGIYKSNVVNISVRSWSVQNATGKWIGIGTFEDSQTVLYGKESFFDKSDPASGDIQAGRIVGTTYGDITIAFGKLFRKMYVIKNKVEEILADYGSFVINTFASDPENKRIYAGTVGGVLYSDDNGDNWKILDAFILFDGEKERVSCKGSKQVNSSDLNTFDNLIQICDLIVERSTGKDRLVAATDNGVYYVDDVQGHIDNRKDSAYCWQGVPDNKCSKTNELSGVVVHSLVAYGERMYAGTAKGVWVSDNRGESWAEFNGGDVSGSQEVYALAVDGENKKIYASGPDGLFAGTLGGTADWKQSASLTDSGTVYSVALDPTQSGTVYIGTDSGVYVSRSFGENWANVSDTMGGAKKVLEVAVGKNNSKVGIYAATEKGAYSSIETSSVIAKTEPVPAQPVEPASPESAINVMRSLTK